MQDKVDPTTAQREALMMGLRLTEGIDKDTWRRKFGMSLADGGDAFLDAAKVRRLEQEGYLANGAKRLKATASGLQRLNALLGYLFH